MVRYHKEKKWETSNTLRFEHHDFEGGFVQQNIVGCHHSRNATTDNNYIYIGERAHSSQFNFTVVSKCHSDTFISFANDQHFVFLPNTKFSALLSLRKLETVCFGSYLPSFMSENFEGDKEEDAKDRQKCHVDDFYDG